MRLLVIILLACFWIALAINSYSKGEPGLAAVFILIGTGLTIYRLNR